MAKITNLKVRNFKSYNDFNLDLGMFNVIIGANASGKSNLVSIFKFLHDISISGLEDAISQQGGVEWVKNVNLGYEKNLEVEVTFSLDNFTTSFEDTKKKALELGEATYAFRIKFFEDKNDYEVIAESLQETFKVHFYDSEKKEPIKSENGKVLFNRTRQKGLISKLEIKPDVLTESEANEIASKKLSNKPYPYKTDPRHELFMMSSVFSFSLYFLNSFFRDLQFFDIDPKLAKNSYSFTGKKELECDGSNLALVLSKMLQDEGIRENVTAMLKNLLPFVQGLSVKQLPDKSLITYLNESYCRTKLIPAPLISDGTINITALLVALFSRAISAPPIIIEEPDRNIHPALISRTVEVLKDVSETRERQIILTTHNPQFIKHSELENIILVSRDGCFSKLSRTERICRG